MIDHQKLNRLTLDRDTKGIELRGISDLARVDADLARSLAALFPDNPYLDMTGAELAAVQIDWELARSTYGVAEDNRRSQLEAARGYRAAKDRANELQRRTAALQGEFEPLAQLVNRLSKYAAGSA